MTAYIIRRIGEGLVTLVALSFVVFGSVHLTGDPARFLLPISLSTTNRCTSAEGRLWVGQAVHRPVLEFPDQSGSPGLRRFLHGPAPGSGDPAGAHPGDRPSRHSRYDPGYWDRSAPGHNLCGETRHLPGPDLQGIRHFWHGGPAILGRHHADHRVRRLLGLAAGLWARRYDGMVPTWSQISQYACTPDSAGFPCWRWQ